MTEFFSLSHGFRVAVTESLDTGIAPGLGSRIDRLWHEQNLETGGRMTDGPMFSVIDHDRETVGVSRLSYRYVVAAKCDPAIRTALALRPLGVTGILNGPDGILLGRRAAHVSYPGLWETAPSGGLDAPDPQEQILRELREEVGLGRDQVQEPRVIGMLWDPDHQVFDIMFHLRTELQETAIRAAHQVTPDPKEYSELAFVPLAALEQFLEANRDQLLPALPAILKHAGLRQ